MPSSYLTNWRWLQSLPDRCTLRPGQLRGLTLRRPRNARIWRPCRASSQIGGPAPPVSHRSLVWTRWPSSAPWRCAAARGIRYSTGTNAAVASPKPAHHRIALPLVRTVAGAGLRSSGVGQPPSRATAAAAAHVRPHDDAGACRRLGATPRTRHGWTLPLATAPSRRADQPHGRSAHQRPSARQHRDGSGPPCPCHSPSHTVNGRVLERHTHPVCQIRAPVAELG
jgi:hypothetical protein